MSTNGGVEMSVEEAADFLRAMRETEGPDRLRETFETGGGLASGRESDLQRAIEVLGRQRAADILGVDVPDGGVPGEQRTLTGEEPFPDVAEERPEPVPEGTAALSEFTGGDEPDELTVEEAENVVVTVANMEGADAIEAFLEPGEVASLGMGQSVQLSDALEILGEDRVRELAGLEGGRGNG